MSETEARLTRDLEAALRRPEKAESCPTAQAVAAIREAVRA